MSDKLTFGQKAVGLTKEFILTGDPAIVNMKQLYAVIIDRLDEFRKLSNSEQARRHAAVAITDAETAQMRAVRAVTWQDPPRDPFDLEVDVIKKSWDEPVLLDFYTETCRPCHLVAPLLKQLAEDMSFTLIQLNAREYPDVASQFRVMGVPRLILFHEGAIYFDSQENMEGMKVITDYRDAVKHAIDVINGVVVVEDDEEIQTEEGHSEPPPDEQVR